MRYREDANTIPRLVADRKKQDHKKSLCVVSGVQV